MSIKKTISLFLAFVALGSFAQAQTKFASVDMQEAMQRYWKTTSEQQKLEESQRRHQDLLRITQEEVQELAQQGQEALDNSENAAFSAERQEEFRAQAQEIQNQINRKRQQVQAEQQAFQARFQRVQQMIQDDIALAVEQVAKRNNIDVVFPAGVAVYAGSDITDQVVQELNKSAPAAGSADTGNQQ